MPKIEKISRNDLPGLAVLFNQLTGSEQHLDKMEKSFDLIKNNKNYIVLGAKIEGILIGSLMGIICHDLVDQCRPFMIIENVIVLEKYRGRGIGRLLMKTIEDICTRNNCSYTMFVSGSKRKAAHKFYEALGYSPDEVRGFKKFFK